jgi:hypothetical protein
MTNTAITSKEYKQLLAYLDNLIDNMNIEKANRSLREKQLIALLIKNKLLNELK